MSDNNNLPQKKDSAGLALQKTGSLLSITDKILANRTQKAVVESDAWLDELIAWADENGISEEQLPRDKQAVLALPYLSLFDNQLTELPESIGKLTNLIGVYLDGNQLTELPESIGKLTNLIELFLGRNKLTKLPESIGNLTNLTRLHLYGNQLTELPESIGKLANLTALALSDNELTELPDSIGNLTHLTWISLFHNPIDEELLSKLSNLRGIICSDEVICSED